LSQNFYHITDDLLVKYLLGEASAEERQLVESWMLTDDANKKQYEDFKTIWEESKRLAAVSTVDEAVAWERFRETVKNAGGQKIVGKEKGEGVVRKMYGFGWLRIAALFILIIGAGIIGYQVFREKDKVENLVVLAKQVPVIDTLPDGSVVTLNKNSSLAYPQKFKGKTRPITLKGEAFFNVEPDKEKPFIISVNDVQVKVVGTSFNIRSEAGVTEVIVETGIVEVTRGGKTVQLKPAEKLKLEAQDSAMQKEKVEDKLYNYYRSKEFVCDDTPLWKLVEVLNEAYGANIIIEKEQNRGLRLNTTFNNESLDKILEIVSQTFGLTVIKEKDRIVLK
jgi:ferric-dicitrate binding protein FerR (iron transport regulator)